MKIQIGRRARRYIVRFVIVVPICVAFYFIEEEVNIAVALILLLLSELLFLGIEKHIYDSDPPLDGCCRSEFGGPMLTQDSS